MAVRKARVLKKDLPVVSRVNIASATVVGSTVVYTTDSPHGYVVDDLVTISGSSPIDFDAIDGTILTASATQFSITKTVAASTYYASGGYTNTTIIEKLLVRYRITDDVGQVSHWSPFVYITNTNK